VYRKEGTKVYSLNTGLWLKLDEQNRGVGRGKCSKLGQSSCSAPSQLLLKPMIENRGLASNLVTLRKSPKPMNHISVPPPTPPACLRYCTLLISTSICAYGEIINVAYYTTGI
jgi:hypothetical protein